MYQLFLNGCEQLMKAEVKEAEVPSYYFSSDTLSNQYNKLATKKFHQIRNEILLDLYGSINQTWTVCVILDIISLELLMTQQMRHRFF